MKIARIRDEDRMGPKRPEGWTADDWCAGAVWYGLTYGGEVPTSGVIYVCEWTGSDPGHRQNILHRDNCPELLNTEPLETIDTWEAFRRLQVARELSESGYFRRDLFCELCMRTQHR
ncbi:hypothetical protein [Microbacterium deminutum]|uniref:hypothetical protein n=1 Tax=Microbacterium deminutum TaxID=344164 RepID=UPI0031DBBD20